MTYESTGEVRRPFAGEHYLCFSCTGGRGVIHQCKYPDVAGDTQVIMRPVVEETPKVLAWCAIVPVSLEVSAREILHDIRKKTGYDGIVKHLEFEEKELA